MELYHFSEDPAITQFVPRPPLAHPETEPFVWAIDGWHAPLYYLPRDCPRVCFWPLPTTTLEDRERLWSYVSGRMVIAIETVWLPRLTTTALTRYAFSDATFVSTEDHGVHVSREAVTPLNVAPMGNLLERLAEAEVELRLCPSLVPLGETLLQSSLHFSLIRMRNAQNWPHGTGSPTVPKR